MAIKALSINLKIKILSIYYHQNVSPENEARCFEVILNISDDTIPHPHQLKVFDFSSRVVTSLDV